jgi:hypothetical protein
MPEHDTSGKLGQSFQATRHTCCPVFCRYTFLDTQVALITLISLSPCKRVCLCLFGSLPRSVSDKEVSASGHWRREGSR